MKLTKNVEIGINALNALKSKTDYARVADLAVEVGTTIHFLEQIMRNLKNAGLVTVKRGPGGGYVLQKDAKITAYQVAQALGKDFGTLRLDEAPVSRLHKSIVDAFLKTEI